ncbi:MAG: YidC/Oxa1 family insertase periplasmic-domain containing protein [Planctomycetota bacterium]
MRLLVPLVAIAVGVLFALAFAFGGGGDAPPIPEDDAFDAVTEAVEPAADPVGSDEPAPAADLPEPAAEPDPPAPPEPVAEAADTEETTATPTGLRVVPAERPLAPTLGGDDPDGPFKFRVAFTSFGAGLSEVTLADYAQFVDPPADGGASPPYRLLDVRDGLADDAAPAFYPYAALTVTIDGQTLALDNVRWAADPTQRSDTTESVTYRLPIVDADGQPVAEIVRTWTVTAGSYDLGLDQRIVNHTDAPLTVSFRQYGQGDVLTDLGAYLGDRRMYITGHFRDETPPKFAAYVEDSFVPRSELLKQRRTLWPNDKLNENKNPRLAWLASENRYFAVITHAPFPEGATTTAEVPELDLIFPRVGYRVFDQNIDRPNADAQRVALQLGSAELNLPPGDAAELGLGIYAGPRKQAVLEENPYALLHFDKLIRYELGCTWCTFQWLARGLLGYLKGIHWLVSDWGVAIIILVLTVRLLLHPITKRAQTNMMKMGKQMGKLQPEMQKLKEKYKDEPTKLNQETMKLYREAGVNPANMLGCLPMLLQTPIWIALYAMLYFAIELRHEPAFYGVFQAISGGGWHFLEDLSVSDNFIRFIPPDQPAFKLTWLPFIEPEFRSLNILPLLMAVVFFFQMKLTTPPPQNDQQRQQQAIMKFMPFLFPVFLYSAPSGLTLYICASTLAGIVDSYLVRKHVREQEEAGTLFDKKPVKPGGFRDRLQKRVALATEMAQQRQQQMQKDKAAGKPKTYKKRKS